MRAVIPIYHDVSCKIEKVFRNDIQIVPAHGERLDSCNWRLNPNFPLVVVMPDLPFDITRA
jgi:hypothetical protein